MSGTEVRDAVAGWTESGVAAVVARVVSMEGFGGRRAGEVLAVTADGSSAGALLGQAGAAAVTGAASGVFRDGVQVLVDVILGDAEAVAQGLACGGVAKVLIERATDAPAWIFDPPTHVTVVGDVDLARAIAAQARLLGWTASVIASAAEAESAGLGLGPTDALVVLDHDPAVAIPSLAAALAHDHGYVGALGSRGTQANRRTRLGALGVDGAAIDRIHGPVGLDLGARTPEETALAVCAEIIAHRSGRTATSLKNTSGPING